MEIDYSLGVSLRYIDVFIDKCGGKAAFDQLSVFDTFNRHISPKIKLTGLPICQSPSFQNSSGLTGKSTWFVNYSPKCNFLLLLQYIKATLNEESNSLNQSIDDVILWIDIFSYCDGLDSELDSSLSRIQLIPSIISHIPNILILVYHERDTLDLMLIWSLYQCHLIDSHQQQDNRYIHVINMNMNESPHSINKKNITVTSSSSTTATATATTNQCPHTNNSLHIDHHSENETTCTCILSEIELFILQGTMMMNTYTMNYLDTWLYNILPLQSTSLRSPSISTIDTIATTTISTTITTLDTSADCPNNRKNNNNLIISSFQNIITDSPINGGYSLFSDTWNPQRIYTIYTQLYALYYNLYYVPIIFHVTDHDDEVEVEDRDIENKPQHQSSFDKYYHGNTGDEDGTETDDDHHSRISQKGESPTIKVISPISETLHLTTHIDDDDYKPYSFAVNLNNMDNYNIGNTDTGRHSSLSIDMSSPNLTNRESCSVVDEEFFNHMSDDSYESHVPEKNDKIYAMKKECYDISYNDHIKRDYVKNTPKSMNLTPNSCNIQNDISHRKVQKKWSVLYMFDYMNGHEPIRDCIESEYISNTPPIHSMHSSSSKSTHSIHSAHSSSKSIDSIHQNIQSHSQIINELTSTNYSNSHNSSHLIYFQPPLPLPPLPTVPQESLSTSSSAAFLELMSENDVPTHRSSDKMHGSTDRSSGQESMIKSMYNMKLDSAYYLNNCSLSNRHLHVDYQDIYDKACTDNDMEIHVRTPTIQNNSLNTTYDSKYSSMYQPLTTTTLEDTDNSYIINHCLSNNRNTKILTHLHVDVEIYKTVSHDNDDDDMNIENASGKGLVVQDIPSIPESERNSTLEIPLMNGSNNDNNSSNGSSGKDVYEYMKTSPGKRLRVSPIRRTSTSAGGSPYTGTLAETSYNPQLSPLHTLVLTHDSIHTNRTNDNYTARKSISSPYTLPVTSTITTTIGSISHNTQSRDSHQVSPSKVYSTTHISNDTPTYIVHSDLSYTAIQPNSSSPTPPTDTVVSTSIYSPALQKPIYRTPENQRVKYLKKFMVLLSEAWMIGDSSTIAHILQNTCLSNCQLKYMNDNNVSNNDDDIQSFTAKTSGNTDSTSTSTSSSSSSDTCGDSSADRNNKNNNSSHNETNVMRDKSIMNNENILKDITMKSTYRFHDIISGIDNIICTITTWMTVLPRLQIQVQPSQLKHRLISSVMYIKGVIKVSDHLDVQTCMKILFGSSFAETKSTCTSEGTIRIHTCHDMSNRKVVDLHNSPLTKETIQSTTTTNLSPLSAETSSTCTDISTVLHTVEQLLLKGEKLKVRMKVHVHLLLTADRQYIEQCIVIRDRMDILRKR